MTDKMTITAPYIAGLDELGMDAVADILEERGERQSIDSLSWGKEFPYHPLTVFSVAHSGQYLYVDFFVRANFLRAVNYKDNSPVHEDSCIGVYLQPRDGKEYFAFEFNCIGTIRASRRTCRDDASYLDAEQLSAVKRYASCGTRPFQEVEGLFAWNVVVAIPLRLIGVEFDGKPLTLHGNFYKCASATQQPHYLSWAPIDTPAPDFHRPEAFGEITLQGI